MYIFQADWSLFQAGWKTTKSVLVVALKFTANGDPKPKSEPCLGRPILVLMCVDTLTYRTSLTDKLLYWTTNIKRSLCKYRVSQFSMLDQFIWPDWARILWQPIRIYSNVYQQTNQPTNLPAYQNCNPITYIPPTYRPTNRLTNLPIYQIATSNQPTYRPTCVMRLRKGVGPTCWDLWATSRASWMWAWDTPETSTAKVRRVR